MKYLSHKFEIIIPPRDIKYDPGCILRLANGDREAYEWVYKNYCKKVYDYALVITKNEAVSEDVVQSVFLHLWMKREKLKIVSDFNGYFYMLYRNYILDTLKKEQLEKNVREQYYNVKKTSSNITQETVNYKETETLIGAALQQLTSQQQLVFKLSRQQGFKREEIAEKLALSENTVKVHLHKALARMREVVCCE